MAQKDNDLQKIKELIAIMKENELVEVEIKHGDDKIFLKRGVAEPAQNHLTVVPVTGGGVPAGPAGTAATAPPPAETKTVATEAQENLVEVKSPIVGTFYAAPNPDSEPFVEVGSVVEPQTVIGIIEAMKVMNEIKAETSGIITHILVKNGQAVEYGQVLFKAKPD